MLWDKTAPLFARLARLEFLKTRAIPWPEHERAREVIAIALEHVKPGPSANLLCRAVDRYAAGEYTFARLEALDSLRDSIGESSELFQDVLWIGA